MLRKKRNASTPKPPRPIQVAAYARVSSGKDAMLESLSAQVSHYSTAIQAHPGWQFVGVYADEALTGTKDNRPEFQRLLTDCRAGKIDLILVKALSRFARNTVTLLETVRKLKALGVGIHFERENIHTMSAEGELMLTLIAAVAQDESRSVSENCKWRIRSDYEQGISRGTCVYGYRLQDGDLVVEPKEAAIVRFIFEQYIGGAGSPTICKALDAMGVAPPRAQSWDQDGILYIVTNERYIGDTLLQKDFVVDHVTKRKVRNRGELPQFYATGVNEPIISKETFESAQRVLAVRREKYVLATGENPVRPFTGRIICPHCGKPYKYITAHGRGAWNCSTFVRMGKVACWGKKIPDDVLRSLAASVAGTAAFDAEWFGTAVDRIEVPRPNEVIFSMRDGRVIHRTWSDRSRSEGWSESAREQARQNGQKRYAK